MSTPSGSVVTVGTFDGVHVGHQRILEEIRNRATRSSRESVVLTFDPHPLEIVNPQAAPPLLTTPKERRDLLQHSGIDRMAVLAFTQELSRLTPAQFVAMLLAEYGLAELVIGHDHGFGRGRAGDVATLQALGRERGFSVDLVDAVMIDGRPVSSTRVRRAIAGGDLESAARLLGRHYSFSAEVVPGAGRGREIGYRTINLAVPDRRKLFPPDGVYAVHAQWDGGRAGGMMHQGPRPTFGEAARSVEVHLFDVDADLYGSRVQVSWVARLRDVVRFDSVEALKAQLDKDFAAARAALTP